MTSLAREATHQDDAPPNSVQTPDGKRWYTHPTKTDKDGNPYVFTSMSTALQSAAKPGLTMWYGIEAAKLAMDSLPRMLAAARTDPCEKTGVDRCGECPDCLTLWLAEMGKRESRRRADEGTRLHYAVKIWLSMGARPDFVPEMDPEIKPYFASFVKFFNDFGLTNKDVLLSECTVLNWNIMAAGTLDMAVRIHASRTPKSAELVAKVTGKLPSGILVTIIDVKTRERPDPAFYMDHGLQIVGYARCQTIMREDGTEFEMPDIDAGMVVQVRPDDYDTRAVDISDTQYDGFKAHLAAFTWQCEQGGKIVGANTFPVQDELKLDRSKAAAERVLVEAVGLTKAAAKRAVAAQVAGEPWPEEKPRKAAAPRATKPAPEAPRTAPPPAHTPEEIAAAKAEVEAMGAGPAKPRRAPAAKKAAKPAATAYRSVTASVDPFALAGGGRELDPWDIPLFDPDEPPF
jgi:hypothetical protein